MEALRLIPPASGEYVSGPRPIRDGSRFDGFFPKADDRDRIMVQDGEVEDTVELMEMVVHKYLGDTAKIAQHLRRSSTEETCRAIWDFIYHHIQYRLDKRGLEQLRRPARSWAERKAGVDCDCMSIMASGILVNLKIPHSFRITKYSADHWQHVYVIVPTGSGRHVSIDAVVSPFDYEKPFTEKMDYPMSLSGINVAVLSGPGSDLENAIFAPGLTGPDLGNTTPRQDLDELYNYLVATRNSIRANPLMVASIDDPQGLLKMLDYAIQYWNTDKRDEALAILERNEEQLNLRNGFSGTDDEELFDQDEFVLSGPGKKGFFKGIKNAVKKIGEGVKKVAKAVVRFSPVTLVARGGFLAAMKLNAGKMASKLKWAYATQEQAAAKGISTDQWNRSKSALAKVEKLFADKLQGKRDALKKAILNGKAGNLNGVIQNDFQGLGEPVSAATIAAATPVIVAAVKILKESGLIGKNEKVDPEAVAQEAANDPEAAAAMQEFADESASEAPSPSARISNPAQPATTRSETSTEEEKSGDDKPGKGGGIMAFVKANPVPVVIGTGLLAYGVYRMVSGGSNKPKKPAALSGPPSGKRKSKKKNHRPSQGSRKLPVKTVRLL